MCGTVNVLRGDKVVVTETEHPGFATLLVDKARGSGVHERVAVCMPRASSYLSTAIVLFHGTCDHLVHALAKTRRPTECFSGSG